MGNYCMPEGSVYPLLSPVPSQMTPPSAHEDEITNRFNFFVVILLLIVYPRIYCTRAPPTNIFSQFDFDDFPELFKEYQ